MSGRTGRTLLVVDDDPYVRLSLQAVLEAEGYRVVVASSGEEGLRCLEAASPDLVILDGLMPGMDGWETCRRMRALSPVPILMLTAGQSKEEEQRGWEAGASGYLVKPVSVGALCDSIRDLLSPEAGGGEAARPAV